MDIYIYIDRQAREHDSELSSEDESFQRTVDEFTRRIVADHPEETRQCS